MMHKESVYRGGRSSMRFWQNMHNCEITSLFIKVMKGHSLLDAWLFIFDSYPIQLVIYPYPEKKIWIKFYPNPTYHA